jgi:hypothetical protein
MIRLLYSALFVVVLALTYTYLMREHLTTEERVDKLEKEYKKLDETIKTQESRMGGAAADAANKQTLLQSNVNQ